jgi:ribosomal protein L18
METRTRSEEVVAITIIFAFATIFSANIAYGQQLSSSRTASSLSTTTISAKLKAEMCDPSNPRLKVVNTTESHICNIPKTVKNTTTTAAAIATPNNNNIVSRSNSAITAATMTPISKSSNKSLSSPSTIAPQANAINQQQQLLVTISNGTAGQNYTFAAATPAVASGKLMYLGNHGDGDSSSSSTPTNPDTSPKDKDSSDKKPSSRHSTSDTGPKDKDSSDTKHTKSASDSDTHERKNTKEKNSDGREDSLEGILKEVL